MSDEYTPENYAKFDSWLAAHDAVVRADERKLQAEKDAMIAANSLNEWFASGDDESGPETVRAAIRARFVEQEVGKR